MNDFKIKTLNDYTAYDLDVRKYVHIHNRRQLENMIRRKARRAINAETRKMMKEVD